MEDMIMALTLKKLVDETTEQKAPGPSTTFSKFHIYSALELLSNAPLGRNKLAEKLNVGDGAVRTIINRLKDAELILISREGCILTKKGQQIWQQFEQVFPKRAEIPRTELTTSEFNYAFLVKDRADKIKSGIDQRDAAIIAGAKRAIVLVVKNGCINVASVDQCIEKAYPAAATQILEKVAPLSNEDVIIIAGAETLFKAKVGAFAAAWSLLNS